MRPRLAARTLLMLVALLAILCAAPRSQAASGPEIDGSVHATLNLFFREVWSSRELANKAVAILAFPTVIKAGFGVGGEYGEGACSSVAEPRHISTSPPRRSASN
jgi:lipid-binding SYLF domain-containing protein